MSQSWQIDPKKGDYVMNLGAPVETNSLQVPAYFRLKIKRKQWLYAPDDKYGSDFYLLQKRPASNAAQKIENVAVNALQPLTDDGRASRIDVVADNFSRNGAALTATILDASGEEEIVTFPGLGV
jgi:phage gp46-like protein